MRSLVVPAVLIALLITPLCVSPSYGQLADTEFIRGDMNGDGIFGVLDATFIIDYLFLDGDTPPCLAACDADGDDSFGGLVDVLYLLEAVFLELEMPPPPFPDCGPDADTVEPLGCNNPSCP